MSSKHPRHTGQYKVPTADGLDNQDAAPIGDFSDSKSDFDRPTTLTGIRIGDSQGIFPSTSKPRSAPSQQVLTPVRVPILTTEGSTPSISIRGEQPTEVGGVNIIDDKVRGEVAEVLSDTDWRESFDMAHSNALAERGVSYDRMPSYYYIPESLAAFYPQFLQRYIADFEREIRAKLEPKHITKNLKEKLVAAYVYWKIIKAYQGTPEEPRVHHILSKCFNEDLVNQYPLSKIDSEIKMHADKLTFNQPATSRVKVGSSNSILRRLSLGFGALALSAAALVGVKSLSEDNSDSRSQNIAALVVSEDAGELEELVAPSSLEVTQSSPEDIESASESSSVAHIEPEVQPIPEEIPETEVPATQTESTQELEEPTNELANLLQSLNINPEEIRTLPDNVDISTVGQVPGLTPLYTSQTVLGADGNPITVYSPNADLAGLQVEVRTVQDRLIVRNTQLNDTRQRLRIGQTTTLTGPVRYASIDGTILPYAETTNGDWVALTYLNPVTSLIDATQPNPESLETRYASFVGKDIVYTSKAGTQRVYRVTKAENGQLTLDNNGFSFNVNYSTLENNNSIRVATPEEIQTRKPTAFDNISSQVAANAYDVFPELETA